MLEQATQRGCRVSISWDTENSTGPSSEHLALDDPALKMEVKLDDLWIQQKIKWQ